MTLGKIEGFDVLNENEMNEICGGYTCPSVEEFQKNLKILLSISKASAKAYIKEVYENGCHG